MTDSPYRSGDFVWSNFPERENPARPGPRHIGYVALSTSSEQVNVIFLAYTSSQQWRGPKPPGIYVFDQGTAAGLGQSKPFFLDLRRMALLPATVDWFPELDSPGHGTVGRAPEKLRLELEATALDIARRRPEIMERLGPLGTGRRR